MRKIRRNKASRRTNEGIAALIEMIKDRTSNERLSAKMKDFLEEAVRHWEDHIYERTGKIEDRQQEG